MAKNNQATGLKAYAEQKNQETIMRVNKAIDKMKRKNEPINFESVAKAAGVSRGTLYNNPQLKERITSLRSISKAPPIHEGSTPKKDKMQTLEETVSTLKERVRQLEADKKKLVMQLVNYEEIKLENERLKHQITSNTMKQKDS